MSEDGRNVNHGILQVVCNFLINRSKSSKGLLRKEPYPYQHLLKPVEARMKGNKLITTSLQDFEEFGVCINYNVLSGRQDKQYSWTLNVCVGLELNWMKLCTMNLRFPVSIFSGHFSKAKILGDVAVVVPIVFTIPMDNFSFTPKRLALRAVRVLF